MGVAFETRPLRECEKNKSIKCTRCAMECNYIVRLKVLLLLILLSCSEADAVTINFTVHQATYVAGAIALFYIVVSVILALVICKVLNCRCCHKGKVCPRMQSPDGVYKGKDFVEVGVEKYSRKKSLLGSPITRLGSIPEESTVVENPILYDDDAESGISQSTRFSLKTKISNSTMETTVGDDLDKAITEHSEWFEMKPKEPGDDLDKAISEHSEWFEMEPKEPPNDQPAEMKGSPLLREIAMETGTTNWFNKMSSEVPPYNPDWIKDKSNDSENRNNCNADDEAVASQLQANKEVLENKQNGDSNAKRIEQQSVSVSPTNQSEKISPSPVIKITDVTEKHPSDLSNNEDSPASENRMQLTIGEPKAGPYSTHSSTSSTRSKPSLADDKQFDKSPKISTPTGINRGGKEANKSRLSPSSNSRGSPLATKLKPSPSSNREANREAKSSPRGSPLATKPKPSPSSTREANREANNLRSSPSSTRGSPLATKLKPSPKSSPLAMRSKQSPSGSRVSPLVKVANKRPKSIPSVDEQQKLELTKESNISPLANSEEKSTKGQEEVDGSENGEPYMLSFI